MNPIQEKFKKGELSVGTFTQLGSPIAVECLGRTGLDYVLIDTEHCAVGVEFLTAAITAADAAGIELIDYFQRPELASLNAVPTAEGCICLLMQLRERTIWQSPILVLGYGKVGRAVARRLQVLGGRVTVAARSPEQRAGARCAGCRAADLTQLRRLLPGFDAVVNTIPAPVLGKGELACLPAGALVIDLASLPGGEG